MSAEIPGIKEFPADDQYWRVDWFGAIKQNPNIPTEAYLQIIISPLRENVSIHFPSNELAATRITDLEKRKTILAGTGQLPLISIGSIWRKGVCQATIAGTTETIYNLEVSVENTPVIAGGHKVNGSYLISPKYYTFGKATGA